MNRAVFSAALALSVSGLAPGDACSAAGQAARTGTPGQPAAGTARPQPTDTLVVKSRFAPSSSLQVAGTVLEITPDYLVVESGSGNVRYTRQEVLRVVLSSTHCAEEYDRAANLWNRGQTTPAFNSNTLRDTVFVKQRDQEGVYAPEMGKIREITPQDLTLETATGPRIYGREIVRRVGLDTAHCKEQHARVASYWNREKSWLVSVVPGFLNLGPALDRLPRGFDLLLAGLVLTAVLVYAGYRAYETVIVARALRELNRLKLRMEVSKLRYEVDSLKQQLGITQGATQEPAEAELSDRDAATRGWQLSKGDVVGFLKHKVVRVLSDQEKRERAELWRARWESYRTARRWLPGVMYIGWRSLNLVTSGFVLMFGVISFIDIALPYTQPEDFSGGAGVLTSVIFAGLAVLCLSAFLRLRTQGQIVRATYREFLRSR